MARVCLGGSTGSDAATARTPSSAKELRQVRVKARAPLRGKPAGPAIKTIPIGQVLQVLGEHDGLLNVRLVDGTSGYIAKTAVDPVKR
jgi:hypothetical protein